MQELFSVQKKSSFWQYIFGKREHVHANMIKCYNKKSRVCGVDLQHLGVEKMELPASSSDLNPLDYCWMQLGAAVCARVASWTGLLHVATDAARGMECPPHSSVRDRADTEGDASGSVRFLNGLPRPLFHLLNRTICRTFFLQALIIWTPEWRKN